MSEDNLVALNKLKLDPENANTHTDEGTELLARLFLRFGQLTPFVVERKSKVVKKGNGGLLALQWIQDHLADEEILADARKRQLLMVEGKAPKVGAKITLHTFDNPDEARAYALADNKSSELSQFDFVTVAEQMRAMSERGVSLFNLGWKEFEFDAIKSTFWPTTEQTAEPQYEHVEFDAQTNGQPDLEDKAKSAFQSIQIEFRPDQYQEALDLCRLMRHHGIHLGTVVLEALQAKSERMAEDETFAAGNAGD